MFQYYGKKGKLITEYSIQEWNAKNAIATTQEGSAKYAEQLPKKRSLDQSQSEVQSGQNKSETIQKKEKNI